MTHITLRKFNNALAVIVVLLGLYIVLSPLIPQVEYWLKDKSPNTVAPYGGKLAEDQGSTSNNPLPTDNRIVIPDIALNEPILEGNSIGVINNGGTWRRPKSSVPTEDNNTVIIGHRFFGSNSSTFYNLDKLAVGNKLALYWDGQEILYEITETKVVDPSAVEIEAPTHEKQLTLYTCTPLWTAKNRLVIIAKPVNQNTETISETTE